jgi:hypothetical protein
MQGRGTSKAKSIAEFVVGQRMKISSQTGDKFLVKLASGLGRKLCLGDEGMLMAQSLGIWKREDEHSGLRSMYNFASLSKCIRAYHQAALRENVVSSGAERSFLCLGLGSRRSTERGQQGTSPDEPLHLVRRGGRILGEGRGQAREDLGVQIESESGMRMRLVDEKDAMASGSQACRRDLRIHDGNGGCEVEG